MTEAVVTYTCPVAETEQAVPGPETRIMLVGDGGFIVACACVDEPLTEADSEPHPTTDHLVNIYPSDPSAEEWLRLEAAADGWYGTTAWHSPEGYDGTHGQRHARFRDKVREIADAPDDRDAEPTERERKARDVACPRCGAGEGSKCQRPSGPTVRKPHADRVEAAVAAGVITPEGGDDPTVTQAGLDVFAGGTP